MPYCPKCGKEVAVDVQFCPSCGQELITAVTRQEAVSRQVRQRPVGITILAVLQALVGLVLLGFGILVFVAAGIVEIIGLGRHMPILAFLGAFIIGIIGVIILIISILCFAVTYGYWNGSTWARTLGLVLSSLGILIGLISLPEGLILLVLEGLIIYYLTRAYVKQFFE